MGQSYLDTWPTYFSSLQKFPQVDAVVESSPTLTFQKSRNRILIPTHPRNPREDCLWGNSHTVHPLCIILVWHASIMHIPYLKSIFQLQHSPFFKTLAGNNLSQLAKIGLHACTNILQTT